MRSSCCAWALVLLALPTSAQRPPREVTSGTEVLVVTSAFVCDNGEAKNPCGSGSDWAWYGWKHGPYGHIYVYISDCDTGETLYKGNLLGPYHTHGNTFEWKDNEELIYSAPGFGIFDWGAANGRSTVCLRLIESDPNRTNDLVLSVARIDKTASKNADVVLEQLDRTTSCCREPTRLRLRTVSLGLPPLREPLRTPRETAIEWSWEDGR